MLLEDESFSGTKSTAILCRQQEATELILQLKQQRITLPSLLCTKEAKTISL